MRVIHHKAKQITQSGLFHKTHTSKENSSSQEALVISIPAERSMICQKCKSAGFVFVGYPWYTVQVCPDCDGSGWVIEHH